jgi:CubicO group peptidase (beta-lactamase class C family)
MRARLSLLLLLVAARALADEGGVAGQTARDAHANIDAVAREWLASTGAPSVSIAVVQNGLMAYAQAYGHARLEPEMPATTATRYAIDSVSKEFTAAAVLFLAQQGKLSLDDPAGKWFPDLGEASKVTLRELLTHTAGIRDYWPQDYVPLEMLRPTTVAGILNEWARRPLDFEPGTQWQYSNTGYVLAAAIVEKVSGKPLLDFLREHIFAPLHMDHVTEDDTRPLPVGDAGAYTRLGLGPTRHAPKEGPGWLFGASELAMTPSELALWDVSLMNRSLLSADSYAALFTPYVLKNGRSTDYGLGLDIETVQGRKRIGHDGAGSGYLAASRLWPDEKAAIVVLTNNDWADPGDLLNRIAFVILTPNAAQARAGTVFAQFQSGNVDRSLFTANGNSVLTSQALADLKASLGPLGPARLIELEHESRRGGMITRRWKILCRDRRLEVTERGYPDGQLEEFLVTARND